MILPGMRAAGVQCLNMPGAPMTRPDGDIHLYPENEDAAHVPDIDRRFRRKVEAFWPEWVRWLRCRCLSLLLMLILGRHLRFLCFRLRPRPLQ